MLFINLFSSTSSPEIIKSPTTAYDSVLTKQCDVSLFSKSTILCAESEED